MTELAKKHCVPCRGGVPPLKGAELRDLAAKLGGGWTVVEEHHLEKTFAFEDFRQALDFTNRVGEIAEHEGHHPDIYLGWGKVDALDLDAQDRRPHRERFHPGRQSRRSLSRMKFSAEFSVRFGEIDQARVVYYPRFFHYFHQAFEEWFARALGVSYPDLVLKENIGFPSVRVETEFLAAASLRRQDSRRYGIARDRHARRSRFATRWSA